jgi:asparagine synthase (glutamine-hydrolysing)
MASRLAHRGPDGSSFWNEGPVGFGARILQTTSTPIGSGRGIARRDGDAVVVVADARIDNRRELVGALGLPSSAADKLTDDELILTAYEAWGPRMPERLIGDFAFAIWDRSRRTLFCARDPIGARPFHYHLSDRVFVFASEIKALFCLPEVPRELDEVQVAYFLDGFIDDPQRTFYQGIQRLPAAHFLEVSAERVRMERYWMPDASREIHYPSNEQYAEAFRETFLEAVRCRLRNAVPVGGALSGGLDSSSIVRAARRLLPKDQPMHAFSAVFPDLPEEERELNDESAYIGAVTEAEGIVSHRVRVDQVAPLVDYDRVFWHLDSPPLAFNMYMHWALFGVARREGVRVFLDGTDGDTVVSSGYERFIDLANEGNWAAIIEEVKALTERYESPRSWFPRRFVYPQLAHLSRSGRWGSWLRASNEIAPGLGRSRRDLFLRYGIGAFIPESVLEPYRRGKPKTEVRRPLIRREFARRTGLSERERALLPNDRKPSSSGREAHARALSLPRYQFAMELIDGAAAAFGIEPRYPFFDRRLVEFCIAIPPEQKLANGWTRLILRRAMEGILPPVVQWRIHKGNLGFNFVRGMHDVEGPKLEATLFDDPSVLEDFVEMDVLRSTHRRFLMSEPSLEAEEDAMTLYKATVLARWLRDHGPGASS